MTAPAPDKAAPIPAEDAPYCSGAVAHIDIGGLCDRHVEGLRQHAEKLRWQMENDERPAPLHGWTCFHCAQTFTTWAGASAHFGDDPRNGRPECCANDVEEAIRNWANGPCDDIDDLIQAVRAARPSAVEQPAPTSEAEERAVAREELLFLTGERTVRDYNEAINFAIDECEEPDLFLRVWREGGCEEFADELGEWADFRAYRARLRKGGAHGE